jgi:hypothetical protein
VSWKNALKRILPAVVAVGNPTLAVMGGTLAYGAKNPTVALGGLVTAFAPAAAPLVGAAISRMTGAGGFDPETDSAADVTPRGLITPPVNSWTAGQVLEGGIGGAGVGSIFGPIGAAVGGVIGAGGTILANPDVESADFNATLAGYDEDGNEIWQDDEGNLYDTDGNPL